MQGCAIRALHRTIPPLLFFGFIAGTHTKFNQTVYKTFRLEIRIPLPMGTSTTPPGLRRYARGDFLPKVHRNTKPFVIRALWVIYVNGIYACAISITLTVYFFRALYRVPCQLRSPRKNLCDFGNATGLTTLPPEARKHAPSMNPHAGTKKPRAGEARGLRVRLPDYRERSVPPIE